MAPRHVQSWRLKSLTHCNGACRLVATAYCHATKAARAGLCFIATDCAQQRLFGADIMKNWRQRVTTTTTFIAGLVCGGLIVGFLSISAGAMLASVELHRQFGMKYATYRFLTTNNVPRAQAALIAQMSIDICDMADEMETHTLLPFVKRKLVSELQSVRNSLDYYGLDLGSIESTTTHAAYLSRRADAILSKYTVAGARRISESNAPASGSQSIRSETNRTSSAAGSGR